MNFFKMNAVSSIAFNLLQFRRGGVRGKVVEEGDWSVGESEKEFEMYWGGVVCLNRGDEVLTELSGKFKPYAV